jgi:hypothetical protein
MKKILTSQDNIYGPFDSVQETETTYLCDNTLYQKDIIGPVVISEVPDDYQTPTQIAYETAIYNASQSDLRAVAYPVDSDPIFFQYQRGQKTQQDWLDAVAAVQAEYPYKEQV